MSITATLAAALAIAALGASGAQAQPPDVQPWPILAPAGAAQRDMHASTAVAAAKARQKQDLRSPDARDAALNSRDASPRDAQPVAPTIKSVSVHTDGGVDWMPIALGVGAGLLAMAGLVALSSRRTRRLQRSRVTV